eukprot:3193272-Pyramimonas_sp.AAC.1
MAEAVDLTTAVPAGHASDYSDALSTVTDVTFDTDTPMNPMDITTEDMDLSPGRKVAYRAGSVGWVKSIIDERLSVTCPRGARPLSGYGIQEA